MSVGGIRRRAVREQQPHALELAVCRRKVEDGETSRGTSVERACTRLLFRQELLRLLQLFATWLRQL